MINKKVFLVINAEGEARLVKRPSYIGAGEVAFELRIHIPNGWGGIAGSIDVAIPEPPTVTADGAAVAG